MRNLMTVVLILAGSVVGGAVGGRLGSGSPAEAAPPIRATPIVRAQVFELIAKDGSVVGRWASDALGHACLTIGQQSDPEVLVGFFDGSPQVSVAGLKGAAMLSTLNEIPRVDVLGGRPPRVLATMVGGTTESARVTIYDERGRVTWQSPTPQK